MMNFFEGLAVLIGIVGGLITIGKWWTGRHRLIARGKQWDLKLPQQFWRDKEAFRDFVVTHRDHHTSDQVQRQLLDDILQQLDTTMFGGGYNRTSLDYFREVYEITIKNGGRIELEDLEFTSGLRGWCRISGRDDVTEIINQLTLGNLRAGNTITVTLWPKLGASTAYERSFRVSHPQGSVVVDMAVSAYGPQKVAIILLENLPFLFIGLAIPALLYLIIRVAYITYPYFHSH